jgi:mono/diheme cytochrome c family protein
MMKMLRFCSITFASLALLALLPRLLEAQAAPDGKALYEKFCKSCHGPAGGQPSPAMVKSMKVMSVTEPVLLAKFSADSLVMVLEKGTGTSFMKPYTGKMSREEMTALAKYLKSFEKKSDK